MNKTLLVLTIILGATLAIPEIAVSELSPNKTKLNPSVATLSDGNIIIVWRDNINGLTNHQIKAKIFSSSLTEVIKPEFIIYDSGSREV